MKKLIVMLLTVTTDTATGTDLTKLDEVGNKLLTIGQKIGYWVVVVVTLFQVIRAAASGDRHKIGEILLMAVLVYGALFIIPYALNLIEGIF